jgi:hypothetical protein
VHRIRLRLFLSDVEAQQMDYWALVKALPAEARALHLLDQNCLTDISVMIEPAAGSSKLAKHDDINRRLEAATRITASGALKFRPLEIGDVSVRPRRFALDCTKIARRFRVNVNDILVRALPELMDSRMPVIAVFDIESMFRAIAIRSTFMQNAQGAALKLRKSDLRGQNLTSMVDTFQREFNEVRHLSLYVDLGFVRADNVEAVQETLKGALPSLSRAFSRIELILGAYSSPDWTMLPKAGQETAHARSDLDLVRHLKDRLPATFGFCDRGIVSESFAPKRVDDRQPIRHPPVMTVTTKTQFRSARAARDNENYAVPMESLTRKLVNEHFGEFFKCKPFNRLIEIGRRNAMIRTRGDRIANCQALHINQTYLSIR